MHSFLGAWSFHTTDLTMTILNWEQRPSSVMLASAVHCTQLAVYQDGKSLMFLKIYFEL